MEDWQQRVIDERDELSAKLDRLCAFLASERSDALMAGNLARLEAQAQAMTAYLDILNERIREF